MGNLLEQWIEQGYAVYPTDTLPYQFHAYCKAQNIPQITAIYPNGSKYAIVEIDYITTKRLVLSNTGKISVFRLLDLYTAKTKKRVLADGRYSYARYVPRASLNELMPQIVAIVRNNTEQEAK